MSASGVARNFNWGLRFPPAPCPSPFFLPFLPLSLLPFPFFPLFSPIFPLSFLESRPPKIQPGGRGVLRAKLVHFSVKRWYLVTTISIIFSKINWLNWQISCSFYTWLFCLADLWGAWAPCDPPLATPLCRLNKSGPPKQITIIQQKLLYFVWRFRQAKKSNVKICKKHTPFWCASLKIWSLQHSARSYAMTF